ncbi:MAG: SGNH/GDSL hydrolase family protein [Gammaproteobacteria bacterium]|nr:SGNH/GDSL hydrolase family protein [Gammaproteobacteria bacterium]
MLIVLIIILLPILIPQVIYVRRKTLRMPPASGERFGKIEKNSSAEPISITFIGESPVEGVGVTSFDKSLTALTAEHLSKQLNCNIHWHAIGKNGIDIKRTKDQLISEITTNKIDYLVVSLGVNDTKNLTPLADWEKEITRLIDKIENQCTCQILFLGAPDMAQFTALPAPLSTLLGYRTNLLNFISKHHRYSEHKYKFISSQAKFDASYLAEDGFHPSEKGCDEMGKAIANFIATA